MLGQISHASKRLVRDFSTIIMPITKVVVNNQAEFDEALEAHVGKGSLVTALFTGAVDAATGKSWCPDCVDAAPVVDAAIAKAAEDKELVFIYAPLVRAEYSGQPGHWARVHPAIKLQRIPTLFRWGAAKVTGAAVEEDCKDATIVEGLLE